MIRYLPLLLLLAGCGGNDNGPSPPPPSPTPTPLPVWISQTHNGPYPQMTVYSAASFSVVGPVCAIATPQVPRSSCSIGYFVTLGNRSLSQHISADVKAEGSGRWDYRTNIDNHGCESTPASVRPYFQKTGDTGGEFGRWFGYGANAAWALTPSAGKIVGDIAQPKDWISVFGKSGADVPAEYLSAKANVQAVGIVFGGGCFAGHGAMVLPGTGASTFTLSGWEAK